MARAYHYETDTSKRLCRVSMRVILVSITKGLQEAALILVESPLRPRIIKGLS
jgi:hypothetical protein